MGHGFWGNLHRLAWTARVIYLLLILIVLSCWRATKLPVVNLSWRIYYHVCGIFATIYLIYAMLLLFDVITLKDYRQLAGWIAVFLFSCILWPATLHRAEWKTIKHYKEDHPDGGN